MNMKQLRYVQVLAQEGTFSRAAETLHISQPSLSQYIRKIENELGVSLFDRTGGEIRVTDAGRVYLDVGRQILDLEHRMDQEFQDLEDGRTGTIVLGVSPYRCIHLMPEAARRFKTIYPGIGLVIEERTGDSLLEDAERGKFDLAIANLPVDSQTFETRLMMREEVLLAVNVETPLYRRLIDQAVSGDESRLPTVDGKELDGADFVTLAQSQPTQQCLDRLCDAEGISVHSVASCRTIETQFAMVRAGIGAALVPSAIWAYSKADQVAFFSLKQEIPHRDVAVIWRKYQYLSKAMRAFVELMSELGGESG